MVTEATEGKGFSRLPAEKGGAWADRVWRQPRFGVKLFNVGATIIYGTSKMYVRPVCIFKNIKLIVYNFIGTHDLPFYKLMYVFRPGQSKAPTTKT